MGNCWSVKKSKTYSQNNADELAYGSHTSCEMVDLPTENIIQENEENDDSDTQYTEGRSADTLRRTKSSMPAFSDRRSSKKRKNQVNKSNGSDFQSKQPLNSISTETNGPVSDKKNSLLSNPTLTLTCKSVKLHVASKSCSMVDTSVKCTKGSDRTYQLRRGNGGRKWSFEKHRYIYE